METAVDTAVSFHKDPLRFLDRVFPAAGDSVWLTRRHLLLSDAAASRAVLANEEGLYEEHSDFFHTRRGYFGPRELQVEMGRTSRAFLRAWLREHAGELPDAIRRALVPSSEWPDAGNWLIYRHFRSALVAPDSPARLLRTMDEIVERAVLAGARERRSRLTRAVFRYRANRELARAVKERRARSGEPADVLEAVVRAARPDVPAGELAEVFLSFLFAVAGSVGFLLGWSLYLLGTHSHAEAEPAGVVREALRLWPVAWLLERRPARPHELAGVEVTPRHRVAVCPYAVHRNPRHWDDPDSFRPERWAAGHDPQAFLPFGWGEHRCVAGTLSMELVEDILRILCEGYRMTLVARSHRPCLGAALAPPRFTLELLPVSPHVQQKGGD
jgi:hypothetical protein